ncbi:hypothetical protein [Nocardia bovistercoris]|uniref:Uncharacterized protein n=1 Tax=Nocardia bovistercoris TaxID=2785916 RepID=A0A931IIQ8_9NOCA|nr:hypothetical protein [Nocardia bovistercoris]MBH0780348.1 hypothetical protein [Nocardia bovistercoris]
MSASFLTVLPEVAVGGVFYSPSPVAGDPSYAPRIRIPLDHTGSVLSLDISDARVLWAGLGAALAEHDQAVARGVAGSVGVAA